MVRRAVRCAMRASTVVSTYARSAHSTYIPALMLHVRLDVQAQLDVRRVLPVVDRAGCSLVAPIWAVAYVLLTLRGGGMFIFYQCHLLWSSYSCNCWCSHSNTRTVYGHNSTAPQGTMWREPPGCWWLLGCWGAGVLGCWVEKHLCRKGGGAAEVEAGEKRIVKYIDA